MKLKNLFKNEYLRNYRKNGVKGQALAIVLCLLLVVSLVVASALTLVGTSMKTNQAYANNTNELYAAEAGIQDGIWQMLNQTTSDINSIDNFAPAGSNTDPVYDPFKFYANNGNPSYDLEWHYPLVDSTNSNPATNYLFNGFPVDINLKNTWVPLVDYNNPSPSYTPSNGVYTPPTLAQVNAIFGGSVVISGQVSTVPLYNGKITNTGASSLPILSIGCWLPQGFSYNNVSSNFMNGTTPLYSSETIQSCAGNVAVVWTFPTGTTFSSLRSVMSGQVDGVQTLDFSFTYTSGLTKLPECLPWVVWGTSAGQFTWDADITVNDMVAEAGNATDGWTDIEAYAPKSQTRMLGNAIAGDYVATGGSNRTDNIGNDGLRETYIASSSSQVSVIPSTASIEAAYLYWGGWVRGDADPTLNSNVTKTVTPSGNTYFYDASVNLTSTNGGNQAVTVDTSNPDDIYWSDKVKSSRGGTITINSGSTTVIGNGTDFQNTGSSGGVPSGGLTRDQIGVENADGTYTWFIVQTVNSNTSLTLKNTPTVSYPAGTPYVVFDGYYYGCKVDVTNFVRNYSSGVNLTATPKVYGDGDSQYTVSNLYSDQYCVQDQDHPGGATETCTAAWGGWSLVIIYTDSSVLGHQLYLYDNFSSIANDGNDHLTQISGFIVPNQVAGDTGGDAVKITAFVGEGDITNIGDFFAIRDQTDQSTDNILWDGIPSTMDPNDTSSGSWVSPTAKDAFNSLSVNSAISQAGGPYYLNASGVDIDTFHVPWSVNLVKTNDTTATIVINPAGDGLVSIYTIASFRSSVTSGGSVSYLIHKKPPS
jgi:hypothetical protein